MIIEDHIYLRGGVSWLEVEKFLEPCEDLVLEHELTAENYGAQQIVDNAEVADKFYL
jgi:hypothetical protein